MHGKVASQTIGIGKMGLFEKLGFSVAPPPHVNEQLQAITRRAERLNPEEQAKTFVALGGLEGALLNTDNRIIFGRRGTGKTHILSFVAEAARTKGSIAVHIDIRSIGSNSYLYIDERVSVAERATRLLRDLIAHIHDKLLEEITAPKSKHNIANLTDAIEKIGQSVKEILVIDSVETKKSSQGATETNIEGEANAQISLIQPSARVSGKGELKRSDGTADEIKESGRIRLSVNIGRVHGALNELARKFQGRIWILIDEWSSLPEELQPYLADFVKRSFFPISNYTVQIAAIEQRATFRLGSGAGTIGIELGSDASADIHLDDYLVFENSPARSIEFFQEMLFRHLQAVAEGTSLGIKSSKDFVNTVFTQVPTFRELVRASEGVPRDAINILQLAASRAQTEKISILHIRAAAKDWYERDKASYLASNSTAELMTQWIINNVIGKRHARAFLVAANARNEILERLFDERILHIAKKSYSAKYDPTIRYRIWKIDYGCYVDRINTSQAPTGFLFENQDILDQEFSVPEDDFRAIRHAVLNIDEFNPSPSNEG